MRFKKGSKVEVLSKHEVPSGSWRCAEITCGNGHNYSVKYEMGATDKPVIERVSRKLIRPCPPPPQVSANCIAGDVVEVLDNYSWKMATVSKVLKGNKLMVRLVGSSNAFKVRNFNIRLRQSWMEGKWVLVGKGSGNHDDQKCNEWSSKNYHQTLGSQAKGTKEKRDSLEQKDYASNQNNINFQESCIVSPKTLKRGSHYCDSQARAHEGIQKFRVIEKDGRYHLVGSVYPSPASLLDDGVTNFFEINEERTRMNGGIRNFCSKSLANNDSDTSSVGSCSIGCNNLLEWPSRILAYNLQDAEDHSSDAESICPLHYVEGNCLESNDEELAAEIHRLELHAYRCTMEALHASGPLSWEQESLMTNLRISLHISNDEHLMELKNLISNANGIRIT